MATNSTPHILVVDDEEVILSLVKDCLSHEGYVVDIAKCGSEAETILNKTQVDLLVTDIRMPDFDGLELYRRAKNTNPHIGAIFMTGYADVETAKDAIKEGALDYLKKPFDIAEIRSSVSSALTKMSRQGEQSAHVELERVSAMTSMMEEVSDLPSLMRISLGVMLYHCDFSRGSVLYWSDQDSSVVRVSTATGDTAQSETESIVLPNDPFKELHKIIPIPEVGYTISSSAAKHPLAACPHAELIMSLIEPTWLKPGEIMSSFRIRRGDHCRGFFIIPVKKTELEGMETKFKFISLTAQQTALSIENLLLLEETRQAFRKLQDLQEKTISLETMAARGEIAAEIGHELKNFLGVVYGNVSLLENHLEKGDLGQYPKYIKAVVDNLEKMKSFTSELMREGSIHESTKLIRVKSQIEELIEYMRPQKRFSEVAIHFDAPSQEIDLKTDPIVFQQLMYNILNNAADACRSKPKPEIHIRLEPDSHADIFTISVADNGCGVDPDILGDDFDNKITTKEDGHGLGLMVCKRIMDSHQGSLTLDSIPGNGAIISLKFPLHPAT